MSALAKANRGELLSSAGPLFRDALSSRLQQGHLGEIQLRPATRKVVIDYLGDSAPARRLHPMIGSSSKHPGVARRW
jgi:hypothetical protein